MVRIEPTIFCKNYDVILTKKDLKKINKKNVKKKEFWTIKRENGNCLFLKENKCALEEDAPLLCRMFPLFFEIDKEEFMITWFLLYRKKISSKKLEEKKKIVFEFLKEASRKELRAYFNLLKFLRLKEIEEEILPKEIIKVLKRKI